MSIHAHFLSRDYIVISQQSSATKNAQYSEKRNKRIALIPHVNPNCIGNLFLLDSADPSQGILMAFTFYSGFEYL